MQSAVFMRLADRMPLSADRMPLSAESAVYALNIMFMHARRAPIAQGYIKWAMYDGGRGVSLPAVHRSAAGWHCELFLISSA